MKMASSSREGSTAKKQNNNSSSSSSSNKKQICVKCIPGLTADHYIKDSQQSVSIAPKCISFSSSAATSRSGGEVVVEILWEAAGSKNNTYHISARGNINNLNVHCSCPAYRKTRGAKSRDGGNKILVCKHLAAALDTVTDHNNAKQAVVNLLDDDYDDDDNDNDHGSRNNSDDEEEDQSTTWEPQRATAMNSKKRAYGASSNAMTNNDHPTATSATTTKTPKAVSNPYKKKPSTATISSNKKIKTTTEKKIYKRKIRSSPEAPFKLFATPQDLQLRRQISDRNHWCWSQCKTLEEMVFGDRKSNNNHDVQWMVISNYLVDFHSLSMKLPELQTIPRVVIFYGHSSSSSDAALSTIFPSATVDIVQLDPTQPANSTSNPLPHTHQYGTHHTKLFLIGYSNKIRVVVSTSNLQEIDDIKANAAYIEEFALKTGDDDDDMTAATKTTSEFEETLVNYIQSYGYDKRRNWTGGNSSGGGGGGGVGRRRERLTETLTRYDYSTARGILIPSIPGYHNLKDDGGDERQQQVGQLKLRQAIRNYTTKPSSGAGPRPIICQFSSMSNLSEKYLRALQMSMDTYLARQTIIAKNNPQSQLQLKLVYPSVLEIRDSFEGYRGGGTVPGGHKNVQKSFLKPLWCRWSGDGSGGGSRDSRSSGSLQASTSSSSNDITKPNNVPHIKSYYQINDDNDGFDWLCITSHNISQAAWGSIGENSWGGKRLYIRSWEMGVLISPHTLGVDKLVCWGNDSGDGSGFIGQGPHRLSNSGINNNNCDDTNETAAITTSTIPMPYHTHSLQRYGRTDEPWAWDVENYPTPDRFGFHSRFG